MLGDEFVDPLEVHVNVIGIILENLEFHFG